MYTTQTHFRSHNMTTVIILCHKSYKLPTWYEHVSFIQNQKINIKLQSFNTQKIGLTFIMEWLYSKQFFVWRGTK